MDDYLIPDLALDLLRCLECAEPWLDSGERWRAYLTEDPASELLVYCEACANREFGPGFASR